MNFVNYAIARWEDDGMFDDNEFDMSYFSARKLNNEWSVEEITILCDNYPVIGKQRISMLLPDRSQEEINCKIAELTSAGLLITSNKWTNSERAIILSSSVCGYASIVELSKLLDRSVHSIGGVLSRMGLMSGRSREIAYPLNIYEDIVCRPDYTYFFAVEDKFIYSINAALNAIENNSSNKVIAGYIVKALKLKYKIGFEYNEIASILNIDKRTVSWLLRTGIDFMRQALTKERN